MRLLVVSVVAGLFGQRFAFDTLGLGGRCTFRNPHGPAAWPQKIASNEKKIGSKRGAPWAKRQAGSPCCISLRAFNRVGFLQRAGSKIFGSFLSKGSDHVLDPAGPSRRCCA